MHRIVAIALIAASPVLAATRWTHLSTPDFDLYTTTSGKQGRETLRHFEQVREFFQQASPVRLGADVPLRIIQFDTEEQYKPFRPGVATAYFIATPAREYIVMGDQAAIGAAGYGLAIHEYTHLIVRHSGLKLPVWLNEGWADVYSTLRPMGKDTAIGDLLPDRMHALETEEWMNFDTLTSITTSSPEYHEASRVGIFYAESWALVHMLYLDPEYKDNFGKFLMALNSGKTSAQACEIAFGRTSTMVFQDLRSYFDRKKIYGRVFETRLARNDDKIQTSAVREFDSRLLLADLRVAIGKRDQAKAEYARLDQEEPGNPVLAQSLGNLALWSRNASEARRYFSKAFEEGNSDPQLCYDLAMLDSAAKDPPNKVIPILERAIKSKPDFTDAKVQLGLLLVETRDFPGAVETLMPIPNINPKQAPTVLCGLAYAQVQTGDLVRAQDNAENCRKWSKTDGDIKRAERIARFVTARSKPEAAVRPNEKLQRVVGVTRSIECSPEGNRLRVMVGDKLVAFDLPEPDAVENPVNPSTPVKLSCGALPPIRIGVEFAPPRSAMETSIGIVRRLEY